MNGDEKIVFYVIYRSPNSTPDNTYKLCDLINNAPAHGFNIFIGDFNLPDIDWENNCAGRKSCYFLDTVNENFYSQLVDFPMEYIGSCDDKQTKLCQQYRRHWQIRQKWPRNFESEGAGKNQV